MEQLDHIRKTIQKKAWSRTREEFVYRIMSRFPVVLYKHDWVVSRHPKTSRVLWVKHMTEFEEYRQDIPFLEEEEIVRNDFFLTYQKLFSRVSLPAIIFFFENENCEYADAVLGVKNVYLSFVASKGSENVCYSFSVKSKCINIFNSFLVWNHCENIYSSKWITSSYNIFYSKYIWNCRDCWFSHGLIWCTECLWCTDLENASYCIENKHYSQEDYQRLKQWYINKQLQKIIDGSYSPPEGRNFCISSDKVTWSYIISSEHVENWYFVQSLRKGKNLYVTWSWSWWWSSDQANVFSWWGTSHFYNIMWWGRSCEHIYCSANVVACYNVFYSYFMDSCSYCFWCIWLKNKEYCLFNKQYSKEDRYEHIDRLTQYMEQQEVLWDFFPWSMSPFYFNDSAAALVLWETVSKEQVLTDGYLWRDESIVIDLPEWTTCISSADLSNFETRTTDWISIDPSILQQVIETPTWDKYRIIAMELAFLQKYWLPLPRRHRLERLRSMFRLY